MEFSLNDVNCRIGWCKNKKGEYLTFFDPRTEKAFFTIFNNNLKAFLDFNFDEFKDESHICQAVRNNDRHPLLALKHMPKNGGSWKGDIDLMLNQNNRWDYDNVAWISISDVEIIRRKYKEHKESPGYYFALLFDCIEFNVFLMFLCT